MNEQVKADVRRFIADELKVNPDIDRYYLVQKTEKRFDLTALQSANLLAEYLDPDGDYAG